MPIQPTASKSALLLQCPRPFEEGTEIEPSEPGEAAVWGTRVHKALERCAKAQAPTDDAEVENHASAMWAETQRWMKAGKWRLDSIEVPKAWRDDGNLEGVAFDEPTHTYELRDKEIGMTCDLVLKGPYGKKCVLDYKTGEHEDYTDPRTPQLLTLAAAEGADTVVIVHMARGGISVVYEMSLSQDDLKKHELAILQALDLVGSGFIRPGKECRYCPARGSCPAQVGELLQKTSSLVKAVTGAANLKEQVDPGKFHMMLGSLEKLVTWAKAELKERVLAGEVIERPDGKVLVIGQRAYESVVGLKEIKEKNPGLAESLKESGLTKLVEYTELRAK